jgi:dTDP-4-amino-4,6-dideoxygalactose transaminase
LPESEAYARSAITLPLYPTLDIDAQDRVIEAVREVL